MSSPRQEHIPARRRRRFAPTQPVEAWARWKRFLLDISLFGVSAFSVLVLMALMAAELAVVRAVVTS